MAANIFHDYDLTHGKRKQRARSSTCLRRCWDYFVRKLLDNSDPTWREPIIVIFPTSTSQDTIILFLHKVLASIEIRTYHTGSQTITEQLSASVFRNDSNSLVIQIPEWLASSLDQRNGAQTTFNLAVFLLFSFYHGVLHRCLDVLSYSGFSAPDLGGSYDARSSPPTGIKQPSLEHIWMCCQSRVFGGLIGLDCGLPASKTNRQWDNVCFSLACSTNSLNNVTVMPNFRYIQELIRQISDDVGNVVDWQNAWRTLGGSNVLHCPCCLT
ncbi:hypothetical protein IW261DRAFT_735068 [Armillaria novae-zelandiae]|uniref:Uncharacterized protein n=1 Tax=Armillaria novae-zelandiae TaxID=153914 RepID=A0AA39NVF7_9AGAR|nr:hypothetical protein IW261DRAFT_735068 [Armillaria novae-zelandiae]